MKSEHFSRNGFLTERGYAELAQRTSREGLSPRGVDEMVAGRYLDKVGSVSALDGDGDFHVFDDELLDQQYRRFRNGS